MTRAEAHQVLDAARAGRSISSDLITLALQVTGDLQPLRLFDRNRKRVSAPALPSTVLPADPALAPPQVPMARAHFRLRLGPYNPIPEAA